MTFWVVADDQGNPRVDEIVGATPGLLLSDEALTRYYRIQPIYFWDQGYGTLVPDLRYLPLTIKPDQRASRLVQWLVAGPSSSLAGGVQGLPTGTSPTDNVVTKDDGTLVVKLSAQAGAGGGRTHCVACFSSCNGRSPSTADPRRSSCTSTTSSCRFPRPKTSSWTRTAATRIAARRRDSTSAPT